MKRRQGNLSLFAVAFGSRDASLVRRWSAAVARQGTSGMKTTSYSRRSRKYSTHNKR